MFPKMEFQVDQHTPRIITSTVKSNTTVTLHLDARTRIETKESILIFSDLKCYSLYVLKTFNQKSTFITI